ncbi:2,3-dihydro-2,3-dihydroxybenzoate dehydrogenase [Actinocorallia sp. A-T 12471]|uniref:2,3-dihydro-2,3-dihydroxybenzoate dehydrogenase n=1 Tax=Actinocorallia sp. A-T 12471 TaxID=3089813 RepID=UPI0029CE5E87|nr:2,3-dihydro-2,3-dihydroxybenzoate dehydrogenase [Actinocorallia sp. A-T 12471]MDX6740073.1 2,3-dihydro-2,3-dihydroxybenzoate dehydrogenase [Actinocorallia sp. A-T 12471]
MVAVVSGAGGGIGAATALALARAGRTVAALDRDADALRTAVAEMRAEGLPVEAYPADVSASAEVEKIFDEIETLHGPVDELVNVAGVLRAAQVVDTTDEDWAATFAVNTTGVFVLSRAAARRMTPRGAGAIVTVSSNAGGVPRAGIAAYAASKAAATHFTRCLGLELGPHGIRCNTVSPGSTETPMLHALGGDPVAGDAQVFRTGIPLGRVALPSDIADAVLFLLSDQARHITMHDLYVDGGATLRA